MADMATSTVWLKCFSEPIPAPSWQVEQTPLTRFRALCTLWLPEMLGKAPPEGGLLWQEVQFCKVRGDPARWQLVQDGPTPPTPSSLAPWHRAQATARLAASRWVTGPRQGTESGGDDAG